MGGRTASNAITRYSGLQVQTSSLGVNINVGWGTFRCGTNLVDYLDFKSKAQKAAGGKGGSVTTGYSYSATVILAICEGPIDGVSTVYVDSKVYTNGSTTALAQAGLTLSTGAIGQAVWSYLTTNHPTHAIGYSGLAIAYAANYALDSGASTPNHSFEIVRTTTYGVSGTPDGDASIIVADFFQNARYGVPSWPSSGLLGSMTQFQNYVLAAGLLISPVIDSQRSASDVLTEWLLATNSDVVWSEGVLKFIPYGDQPLTGNGKTYTPNNTPVYNLTVDNFIPKSEGDDPVLVDIQDQSDAFNVIQLEFLDRTNQYNMAIALRSDAANVAQYSMRRKDPDTVHCICDPTVAAISAQLYLQRILYIRGQYHFSLDDAFALLEPGDILELTEPGLGLNAYPVRIIQIDENQDSDTAAYDLICEDFPIGVGGTPLFTMQTGGNTPVNQGLDPGGVEMNLLLWSGDQTNAVYTTTNVSVVGNVAADQYGLTTADALVPTGVAIGTPTKPGTAVATAGSATLVMTTSGDSPAGTLQLLLAAHGTAAATISSVTDSGSNTYTAGTQITNGAVAAVRPFYSAFTTHLPPGSTATTTFSTTTVDEYAALISIPGIASASPLDTQAAGTTGTGTTPSIATGTLGNANDIVVGFIYIAAGASDTFTEASGWTTGGAVVRAGGGVLRWAYKIVSATTTQTYNPTLGTSRAYAANVMSFKRAASALAVEHTIAEGLSAFAGLNYTFSVCIDPNTHKNARVFIGDTPDGAVVNGGYIEVDTSAGAILTQGTAVGAATMVAAALNASLVAGIYNVQITVQMTSATSIYMGVSALSDAGALLWAGDGSQALYLSQWQGWQGLQDGRVYAATTNQAAGPVIFNKPSVLNNAQFTASAAVAGGPNLGGANVYVSLDGSAFGLVGTIDAPARFGVLTANFGSSADPDTTDTLSLDLGASGGSLTSASTTSADQGGTLALVDQELVTYSTATLTNPSRYRCTTYLRRGYLGTTIAAHVTGGQFIRLDDAIFDFPYYATNASTLVAVKFQPFNLWGGGSPSLADCNAYMFEPGVLGARQPGAAAWTAVGTTLSNSGQSLPAIQIVGTEDNPSATGVVFYYRQTGATPWNSAGLHPITTTVFYITSVASGQTYDVGVAYQVNGVVGSIQLIASGITVGSQSSGSSPVPGTTIVNTQVTGSGSITLPSGSYAHVDVYLVSLGGGGYYIPPIGKGYGTGPYGGSGASAAIYAGLSVTPGTTVINWNLSSATGTPSTATATGMSLSCPTGINATSSGAAAAPSNATGGTTNYVGHKGGLVNTSDGGGAADNTGTYHENTVSNGSATYPGQGASGSGTPGAAQIIIIARA